MRDLPPEIWLHISSFICKKDLYPTLGFNRVLFNVALDRQWKDVRFSTGDMSYLDLQRISDPFIAKRIETMHIQLATTAITLYIDSENVQARYIRVLRSLYSQIFDGNLIRGTIDYILDRPRARCSFKHKPPLSDVIKTFHAITPLLLTLRELTVITSHGLSYSPSYPFLRDLLSSYSAFSGTSLRQLSLEGTLDEFSILLQHQPSFINLEALNLVFKSKDTKQTYALPQQDNRDIQLLVGTVAPFVNTLRCHLRELSIKSYFALDLSGFFRRLCFFPYLAKIDIRMAFHDTIYYPPSAVDFIADHSLTLRDLRLPLIVQRSSATNIDRHSDALGKWLVKFGTRSNYIVKLQRLEIYPTRNPAGLEVLLACIRRASKSLKEISIRGRFFSRKETDLILDTLSQCMHLQSLSFNTCQLEIELLDALSSKIPHVERITMLVENVFQQGHNINATRSFPEALRKRRYISWNLKHLQVKPKGSLLDSNILYALAKSIPSLQFLGGIECMFARSEPT